MKDPKRERRRAAVTRRAFLGGLAGAAAGCKERRTEPKRTLRAGPSSTPAVAPSAVLRSAKRSADRRYNILLILSDQERHFGR